MSQATCSECGRRRQVTPELQGRKVKCPCGHIYRMPGEKIDNPNANRSASERAPALQDRGRNRWAGTGSSVEQIEASCPYCGSTYRVKAQLGGKQAKCRCGQKFEILIGEEALPMAELIEEDVLETPRASTAAVTYQVPSPEADPLLEAVPFDPQFVDWEQEEAELNAWGPSANDRGLFDNLDDLPDPGSLAPHGSVGVSNPYWNKPQVPTRTEPKVNYVAANSHKKSQGGGFAQGHTNMLIGAVVFVIGLAVTVGTYMMADVGDRYIIAYGAIVWGLIQFGAGVAQVSSGE